MHRVPTGTVSRAQMSYLRGPAVWQLLMRVRMQVYIKKEARHAQRMSVRAKYMTTDPAKNKYIKNIRNIRLIQEYLLRTADKLAVPKVANSNVDMSVEVIHKSVMAALQRWADL
jgi:2-phosphoglycerate kinase